VAKAERRAAVSLPGGKKSPAKKGESVAKMKKSYHSKTVPSDEANFSLFGPADGVQAHGLGRLASGSGVAHAFLPFRSQVNHCNRSLSFLSSFIFSE